MLTTFGFITPMTAGIVLVIALLFMDQESCRN